MNYLKHNEENREFDYSLLDITTATNLKKYGEELNRLYNNYSIEVGEVLYKAQQEFANPKDGVFLQWIEYKGIKTQNAYNYINIYKAFQSLESNNEKEIFIKSSKSLQIEMSKPSANSELNQRVLDGDITTHKDYKEQEKIIKEQEKTIKEKNNKIKELENKKTEEVVPHDYDGLKSDVQQLELANKELRNRVRQEQERNEAIEGEYQRLANERKKHQEDSEKYRQLNEEMKKMNNQLTDGQKKLKAQKEVYDLVRKSNEAIKELAPLSYLIDTDEIIDNDYARKPIEKIADNLDEISNRLRNSLEGITIIEG